MLVFAVSGKANSGCTVTSCNVMYRRALHGSDVCYFDFDFTTPTAGTVFEVNPAASGVNPPGLGSYLRGLSAETSRLDIWAESERETLRERPRGAGLLTLFPGDRDTTAFPIGDGVVQRGVELFLRTEEEFEISLVDLGAGSSSAIDFALEVTAHPNLRHTVARWLIFHRWTRQGISEAADLVFGDKGIVESAVAHGHDRDWFYSSVRFVRTAVLDLNASEAVQIRPIQIVWLRACNQDLQDYASRRLVDRSVVLGQVPIDPVLQCREQLISDEDVSASRIANAKTAEAFSYLALRLNEGPTWEGL